MRSLDEIVAEATDLDVHLRVNTDSLPKVAGAVYDNLFHIPLLALAIVTIVRLRKDGLPTVDLATWTLATLARHFDFLRLARCRLQWSMLLRRRCADALVFLENTGLVSVTENPTRVINLTTEGHKFLRKVAGQADEAGVLVRQIDRAYRAVEQHGFRLL